MAGQSAARRRHAQPADVGVALDSYDREPRDLDPPLDLFEREQSRQSLHRIGRKLRTSYHCDFRVGEAPGLQSEWPAAAVGSTVATDSSLESISRRTVGSPDSRTAISWLISLLLASGGASLCLGVSLLAWSAAFQLPRLWQWGMTTTIAAEGALMLGLVWMAARLWHNGRRVNRQLSGVDRQLTDLQQLTGSLAGSRMSSSQHFYDHFNQTASPHMLVANLRGQVDQLASRLRV